MRKMFSKNQIKEIVNDGIQSGEIEIGTKLYLHEISIIDDDIFEAVVTILSTKENIEQVEDLLSAVIVSNTYPDADPVIVFKFYYDGTYVNAKGIIATDGSLVERTDIQFDS